MTNEFQPDDEFEEESDLLEEDTLDSEDSDQPEDEEQPDPMAEIRSQLDSYKPLLDLNPAQVRSELGRIRAIQSTIDKMQKAPTVDYAPRLEQVESYLEMLADAIIGSDFAPDDSKQRISTLRETRRAEAVRREIIDEVRGSTAQPESTVDTDPDTAIWVAASNDVVAEAQALDFDPNTIPVDVWLAGRALGSVYKATQHVVEWMKEQQKQEDTPSERVATRKKAAGNGSPARGGGAALSDDELWDDYGLNPGKYSNAEASKKVREAGRRLGYISS